jgi:class 3 adenylate cyclase
MSPGGFVDSMRGMAGLDIRDVLPSVAVPTLVLHRRDDPTIDVGQGRYLAEHVPGADFVELPGRDHLPATGDATAVLTEIEAFVTGSRPTDTAETDRVLMTVLFTDIVRSTEQAVRLGDRGWRTLLDRHDTEARRLIDGFRGQAVKATGDGFLATFDGPARGIRCACALRAATGGLDIELRAGLHTGEVERRGDDVAGIAVNTAARVEALAAPGEVLVSRTVVDLVAGSGLRFLDRGEHQLKGVPGSWRLFAVDA